MLDLDLHVHRRTSQAVLVSDDGDKDRAEWLALSRVEYSGELVDGQIKTFEVPEWVAREKGFI